MNLHLAANCAAIFIIADYPIMLRGKPGVGKSAIWRAIVKALKYDYLIDKRASQMEPVDTIGVPSIVNGRTVWNAPDWLPSEATHGGKRGLNVFDELPDAALATQSALYQWILDRHLAGIDAPKGLRIVAAGNRASDRAAAKRVSSALANRFAWIEVDETLEAFEEFAEHGETVEIDPAILAFVPGVGIDPVIVAFHKWCAERERREGIQINSLHNMSGDDLTAFPSPRSWAAVSKILPCPAAYLHHCVNALIGKAMGSEFMGFLKIYKSLPSWAAIFAAPDTCPVPDELSARYAIACGISRQMTTANAAAAMTYLQRFNPAFATLAITEACKRDERIKNTAAFVQYGLDNQAIKL